MLFAWLGRTRPPGIDELANTMPFEGMPERVIPPSSQQTCGCIQEAVGGGLFASSWERRTRNLKPRGDARIGLNLVECWPECPPVQGMLQRHLRLSSGVHDT